MKRQFIFRLDDASEMMDVSQWQRMEDLLDKYGIKPLVGIIPHCEDPMMDKYPKDEGFWDKVDIWQKKGWVIALHGFNHVYTTKEGGVNPVNKRSEFAGVPYEIQLEKIKKGVEIFRSHGIEPQVFFAPSHTFDNNTVKALKAASQIRIISDTWAWNKYNRDGMTYVPQQSGQVRNVPFALSTFCYHPNTMKDSAYVILESFLKKNYNKFIPFPLEQTNRKLSLLDKALQWFYFKTRK
jgi:predicted deacetylase